MDNEEKPFMHEWDTVEWWLSIVLGGSLGTGFIMVLDFFIGL